MIPVRAHDGLLGWPGIGPTALEDWGAEKFLSNGIFSAPQSGWYFITAAGGGGGGASADSTRGGGAGACIVNAPVFLYDGMCLPVNIGAAGAIGENGGNTSFGDWLILKGGTGGVAGTSLGVRGTIEGRFFLQFDLIANTDLVNIAGDTGAAGVGVGGYGVDVFTSAYHSYSITSTTAADLFKFGVFEQKKPGYGAGGNGNVAGQAGFLLIGWMGT